MKKYLASLLLSMLVALPALAAGEPRLFGDSLSTNSTASGATTAANSMAGKTATFYAPNAVEQNAVSGYRADVEANLIRLTAADSREVRLMIGANDVYGYKNDTQEQAWFKEFLRRSAIEVLTPTKKHARTAGVWTFNNAAQWGNTAVNTFGKYTDTANAWAETTFTGNSVYVLYIIQPNSVGTATITVDGVNVGTLNSDGNIGSSSMYASWGHAAHRFTGFGAGTHTIRVTASGGIRFYLDGIADTNQTGSAFLKLGNLAYFSTAFNTAQSITTATTDAYNTIIFDVADELIADGFNVEKVDINAVIDPTTHLKSDGVHWNDAGHTAAFNAFN